MNIHMRRPWTGQEIKDAMLRSKSGDGPDDEAIEAEANYAWLFGEGQEARSDGQPLSSNPHRKAADAQAWEAGWRFADRVRADYRQMIVQVPQSWRGIAESILDERWPDLVVNRDGDDISKGWAVIEVWSSGLGPTDISQYLLDDPRWTFSPGMPFVKKVT